MPLFVRYVNENRLNMYIDQVNEAKKKALGGHGKNYLRRITITNQVDVTDLVHNPSPLFETSKENKFPIEIYDVIECGYFWSHIENDNYYDCLSEIQSLLNNNNNNNRRLKILDKEEIVIGKLVCAVYVDDADECALYRAKVLSFDDRSVAVCILCSYNY